MTAPSKPFNLFIEIVENTIFGNLKATTVSLHETF